MIRIKYVGILFAVTFQLIAQGRFHGQETEGLALRMPIQLKGLKSVSLVVFVSPFDIPNSEEIRQNIERAAKKIITESGLSLGREQGAWFSILVEPNSVSDNIQGNYFIVMIRTKLSEHAILMRDPTLSDSFVTWEKDWVELVRADDLMSHILEEVMDQVESFCSDWQTVKELTSIESPISVGMMMDKRIYNPSGWNLPETSDLQFESREIITYPDVPLSLEVELYKMKARSRVDEYFILNPFKEQRQMMPDLVVREYPLDMKVFRDAQSGDILCYYYVRLAEAIPRSELEKTPEGRESIASRRASLILHQSYLFDLDDDGKYESEFDASECLVILLKLKLGVFR